MFRTACSLAALAAALIVAPTAMAQPAAPAAAVARSEDARLAEFLQAAYEVIDADYGNVANYLKSGIGLGNAELERLRSLYLQSP